MNELAALVEKWRGYVKGMRTEANTYRYTTKAGIIKRMCRMCKRERKRLWRASRIRP